MNEQRTQHEATDWTQNREGIRNFFDLTAWQKGRELVKMVYEATRHMPREEIYGLTSQVRRSAISIPSNIAEGYGRGSTNDYLHYLRIARGSAYEVQTQLVLIGDLGMLPHNIIAGLIEAAQRCSQVIAGLIRSVELHKQHEVAKGTPRKPNTKHRIPNPECRKP